MAGALDGVAEGVAVVQDGSSSGVSLVGGHYAGFDFYAAGHPLVEGQVG